MRLFLTDTVATLQILQQARESSLEPGVCLGKAGADLLQVLHWPERDSFLGLLAIFDPGYVLAIQEHLTGSAGDLCDAQIEEWFFSDHEIELEAIPPAAPIIRNQISSIESNQVIVVPMNGYAITVPGHFRYVATFDVSSCVTLTLHDPTTGTSVMAHINVLADLDNSLDRILQDLRAIGLDPISFEAQIIGGENFFDGSRRLVTHLSDRLDKEQIPVVVRDYLIDGRDKQALVLDSEMGELFDYVGPYLAPDPIQEEPQLPLLLRQSLFSLPIFIQRVFLPELSRLQSQ